MSHLTAHAKRVCCWAHVNYYKTIRTMTIRWASDKKHGKSLHILRLQDEKSTNKEHSRYLSVTSHMWAQQFKSAINWASFHISFHISYSPLLSETSLREKKKETFMMRTWGIFFSKCLPQPVSFLSNTSTIVCLKMSIASHFLWSVNVILSGIFGESFVFPYFM